MAGVKVLIADDEARMRKLVSDFLKKQGYHIVEADDGEKAISMFKSGQHVFDVVILDVMMPLLDGWSVCKEIRKNSRVPVIMLTAKGEEADELYGFELGADEYITKPFSPMILVARVQALLNRTAGTKRDKISYNGIEIDEDGHTVFVDGAGVDLTPREFELLVYLMKNQGIALSREQILNAVWNYDYFGDTRTVDTHIKMLRLKLNGKGDFIQTVRGVGYKFEVIK